MLAAQSPVLKKLSVPSPLSPPLPAVFYRPANGRTSTQKQPASGQQLGRLRWIRAVMSSGGASIGTASPSVESIGSMNSLTARPAMDVRAVIKIRKKMKKTLAEMVEDLLESIHGSGMGIIIRLVSEEIDPDTRSGKSVEPTAKGWLSSPSNDANIVEYAVDFTVQPDFGHPGAIIITNLHRNELFVLEIVVHGFDEGPIIFPVNSWIHSQNDNKESRILFSNKAYLPLQTPAGLKDLRQKDLISLCGNGDGERKKFERIYDYAPYNDLGNPDKDQDLARPVFGGEEWPFPRRCRTGRPPMKTDPFSESRIEKPQPVYVPRDEALEEIKQASISAGRWKAVLHNLIPFLVAALSSSDNSFKSFSEVDKLYNDVLLKHEEGKRAFSNLLLPLVVKKVVSAGQQLLKFDAPAIISRDRFAWLHDYEFARQMLAGVNPINIERLRELPIISKLDPAIYGPPESAITKKSLQQELNGISVDEAIESGRLFILDYHDMLLPFINKMNSLKGKQAYASRTVVFLNQEGILTPIAIELTLPPTVTEPQKKQLYTCGRATTRWIWKLAKAHVCSNDAGIHQLVNHWLRAHVCMEPCIIATHRQLSTMHPIYKLLHPHMRYTLEINALARQGLMNAGGFFEACYSLGKYMMELSSAAYKSTWRFDMEALPADLIQRGMAVEDPSMPCGVRLVIEDYPYAADGLLIWSAIKDWVEEYVNHFYSDPNSVTSDFELQAWWTEIKNRGHYDKRNEPWWPELKTNEDLSQILTIIIWTASGQHAAINFSDYPFGGCVLNRPSLMRKLIPQEDERDYNNFLLNPQQTFLSCLPTQLQATKVMAIQNAVASHSPDEEYLGQMQQSRSRWISDQTILKLFQKFSERLSQIDEIIHARNKDFNLKNRHGAGIPPYELMLPTSGPGATGRGIPNSITV